MGKHNKENRSLLRQIVNIILVVSFLWVLSISNLTENPIFAIEITLSDIIINNQPKEIPKSNIITVKKDDVVRISGTANPNTVLIASFADFDLEKTVSSDGTWFVLFSITNIQNGEYPFKIKYEDTGEGIILTTLFVTDRDFNTEKYLEITKEIEIGDDFIASSDSKNNVLLPTLIFSVLSLGLGVFLGFYLSRLKKE